jgi:hypothetical protein
MISRGEYTSDTRKDRNVAMETLFAPITRLRDMYHALATHDARLVWDEVTLSEGHSVEDLLRPDYTWEDFLVVVHESMAWLSREVLAETGQNSNYGYFDLFGYKQILSVTTTKASDGGEHKEVLRVWTHSSSEQATTIGENILQLLTRSDFSAVRVTFFAPERSYPWVSSLALSEFVTNCRGLADIRFSLQVKLTDVYLRMLEAAAFPDLRITLFESSLSEVEPMLLKNFLLRRGHGTTSLHDCSRQIPLLSDILRGESTIEELHINGDGDVKVNDSDMSNLVQALATNQSLKVIRVYSNPISDENWTLLWQSLARHPTLKVLRLVDTFCPVLRVHHFENLASQLSNPKSRLNKSLTRRTKTVVEMLRVNTVLEDLYLLPQDCDVHILRNVIHPFWAYRRRVRALSEYQGPGRPQVLGRALYKVHRSPALVWMLFSNNVAELSTRSQPSYPEEPGTPFREEE